MVSLGLLTLASNKNSRHLVPAFVSECFHCIADTPCVLGDSGNEVLATNAAYNIIEPKAALAMTFFAQQPHTHAELIASQ